MSKWKKCETCGEEMAGIKDTPKPMRHECADCKELKSSTAKGEKNE